MKTWNKDNEKDSIKVFKTKTHPYSALLLHDDLHKFHSILVDLTINRYSETSPSLVRPLLQKLIYKQSMKYENNKPLKSSTASLFSECTSKTWFFSNLGSYMSRRQNGHKKPWRIGASPPSITSERAEMKGDAWTNQTREGGFIWNPRIFAVRGFLFIFLFLNTFYFFSL